MCPLVFLDVLSLNHFPKLLELIESTDIPGCIPATTYTNYIFAGQDPSSIPSVWYSAKVASCLYSQQGIQFFIALRCVASFSKARKGFNHSICQN